MRNHILTYSTAWLLLFHFTGRAYSPYKLCPTEWGSPDELGCWRHQQCYYHWALWVCTGKPFFLGTASWGCLYMCLLFLSDMPMHGLHSCLWRAIQLDNYIAFGISGSDQTTLMFGGDATWTWMDNEGVHAGDLDLSAYAQVRLGYCLWAFWRLLGSRMLYKGELLWWHLWKGSPYVVLEGHCTPYDNNVPPYRA